MGNQGTINMPAPGKSPIEGIMQALQAVHAYYGIDTQKAQAKLLESQNELEKEKVGVEKSKNSAMNDFAQKYAAAAQPQAQAQPLQPAQQDLAAAPAPEQPTGPSLGADISIQQPQSPLSGMARSIGSAPQSPAPAASNDPNEGQRSALKAALQNPWIAGDLEPMLKAQSTQQGLDFGKADEQRKVEGQLTDFSDKFNHYQPVMDAKNDIAVGQQIDTALKSGNKAAIQLAKLKETISTLGIKRLGGDGADAVDSKALLDRIDDYIAIAKTGKPSPEAMGMLRGISSQLQKSGAQRLDDLASNSAAQISGATGKDPEWVKGKLLLPLGTQTRESQTSGFDSDVLSYAKRHKISPAQANAIKQQRTGAE